MMTLSLMMLSLSMRASELAVVVSHLGGDLRDHVPVLDDPAVVESEEVVVRRGCVAERALGHDQHEVALADDLVDPVVAQGVALLRLCCEAGAQGLEAVTPPRIVLDEFRGEEWSI